MENFYLSTRSKQRREGVNPKLIEISNLAIQLTLVDFGIPEDGGIRTKERQHKLFVMGASKADGLKKLSFHQSGNALDFYAYVDGKASWEIEHLSMVANAFFRAASILGYKIEWGGLWKGFQDMPHIQLSE